MLKRIIKYRPTTLYAIYAEPRRIEILRAHRKWRAWEIGPVEQHHVPEGESVLDHLQHLNLKARGKGSALLLFLPSTFYSVHREHYPLSIREQLDEAISFDWQENIFHEDGLTLHFSGPPTPIGQYVSVPIFSIQTQIHDKFYQALNGALFHTFAVMPSALVYGSFLPSLPRTEGDEPIEILARILDRSQIELHRFHNGSYLDTVLTGKTIPNLRLFREALRCGGSEDGPSEEGPSVHLLCTEEERARGAGHEQEWTDAGLPMEIREVNGCFVLHWVRHLLEQESIDTFDTELLLKPWEVPRVIWPLLAVAVLFAAYAFYQVHATESLATASKQLRVRANQLEVQWKPIEELQTRISKFREDQKTLSEFSREGYPLLELLTFLTQLTPEDTFLNYLSLRKGQLILRGESKSAIKYLAELSKTDGLSDVKFASPVTRNPASDQERFNVQLQLDIEKLQKVFESLPPEPVEDTKPAVTPAGARIRSQPGAPEEQNADEEVEEDAAPDEQASEHEEEEQ